MSSTPEYSYMGGLPGRKTGRASEKSNFSQTCSLLSQYLKERGSFKDLSLGMTCNLEGKGKPEGFHQTKMTMNLLPNLETPAEAPCVSERNAAASRNVKSMDLFSQSASLGPSISPATTAQMTIFYAGKVIAFDDFPADKAKEVMLLASNGSSQKSSSFTSSSGNDQLNHSTSSSKMVSTPGNNLNEERLQLAPRSNVSDMPIARKVSLHRFLEKRKDRINAKAPYQVSNSAATSSKPAESKTWLGLASEPAKQFEL